MELYNNTTGLIQRLSKLFFYSSIASLKKTCRRLGVNFWAYLQDRVRGLGQIPSLATLIRQKGEELRAYQVGAAPPRGARGGAVA